MGIALILVSDSATTSMNSATGAGGAFLGAFLLFSAAFNAGALGVSVVIQAMINASQRDSIKTELLKDEYYRMEARKRLDKEGK